MSELGPRPAKVTIRALVVSAWRTGPPVLRTLALWFWGIALTAVAVSITVDVQGWGGNLPFTTNLASEAISAMIALPIALLVVSRLASYHVEEATRPRLEARVLASRDRMTDVVRTLRGHMEDMEREATAATNDFVRAIQMESHAGTNDGEIDLSEVNAAAGEMYSVMDTTELVLFQRLIAPVRIYGSYLHNALIERRRDGEFTDDIVELARLSSELESAVANHSRVIGQGQRLFGHRPALAAYDRARINELRNAALAYVKSIDQMLQLCAELGRYASGADPSPDVMP